VLVHKESLTFNTAGIAAQETLPDVGNSTIILTAYRETIDSEHPIRTPRGLDNRQGRMQRHPAAPEEVDAIDMMVSIAQD
jgi:hypothetical protein